MPQAAVPRSPLDVMPRPSPLVTPFPSDLPDHLAEAPRVAWGISASNPLKIFASHYVRQGLWGWGMHSELQIGLLLRGRVRRFYLGHACVLEPGDLWLCGVYEPHAWQILSPSAQWLGVLLLPELTTTFTQDHGVAPDWLAPFARHPAQRPMMTSPQRQQVLALGSRMNEQVHAPPIHHAMQLRLDVMQLLLWLNAAMPVSQAALPRRASHFDHIRTAIALVEKEHHFLSVAQAARACGMETRRFAQLFRQTMGIPFAEFALRHRLHGAAIALRRDDTPLKAIATTWGFTDAAHFSHAFRRFFHCTPGAYRAMARRA